MIDQDLSESIDNLFSIGAFDEESSHAIFCGNSFLDALAEKKGWPFVIEMIKSKKIACSLDDRRYAYKMNKLARTIKEEYEKKSENDFTMICYGSIDWFDKGIRELEKENHE